MSNKNILNKDNRNNNIILLAILMGCCILAIIEILYGQAQSRREREKAALEEVNDRTAWELQVEQNDIQKEPEAGAESYDEMGVEQNGGTKPEEATGDDREYAMQIVVLGDSIMADGREENKDVATLIGEATNAKVYNLAVGGATAALLSDERYDYENWHSTGLLGMVNAMVGNIPAEVFAGYETEHILKQCDFSKTDYFVLEFGINDFLSRQIPQSRYLENGDLLEIDYPHTYAGALDGAVKTLTGHFPNATILVVAPHYCQIFEGETYMGDAYSLNYGYGTLVNFFRVAGNVAEQNKAANVLFFNAMEESGIDAYTADQFLEDGIHLSNEGRRMYADQIAERINKDFYRAE